MSKEELIKQVENSINVLNEQLQKPNLNGNERVYYRAKKDAYVEMLNLIKGVK